MMGARGVARCPRKIRARGGGGREGAEKYGGGNNEWSGGTETLRR